MNKILYLLTSLVMVLSLVLAACTPDVEPAAPSTPAAPTAPSTPTTPTQEKPQQETGAPTIDRPKYGGTMTIITPTNLTYFGAAVSNRGAAQSGYVLEQIMGVDPSRGLGGSGVSDYAEGATSFEDVVGWLAEDWSAPEVGVWVLNIRKGVNFALDPKGGPASKLVNGRQMTAEDVAFSIEYLRDTQSSLVAVAEPSLIKNTVVERTGEWQITVKTPVAPTTGYLWIMGGGGSQFVWPKEFLKAYGTNNDWRNQVGTGPYILTDFVSDSIATYTRNTNYWATNQLGAGKGDSLPYADAVKYLIVPDISTRLAAFRTGKADWIDAVSREDGDSLLKSNPDIKSYQLIIAPLQIAMRLDKKDLAFKDLKVRRALMMGLDLEGMKNQLYGGKAEIIDSPARKLYTAIHTPLSALPETTQELYKYNPDKAKQLLAEAGYPEGFKTKMLVSTTSTDGDLAAVIKDMWAKIGVDLELQIRDATLYNSIFATRNYDEMFLGSQPGGTGALFVRYSMGYFRGPNVFNLSYVNDPAGSDPIIEKAFEDQSKYVMVNYPKADEVTKAAYEYILGQAFLLPTPARHGYRLWQPWVKNYYGEGPTKFWLQHFWIDQDLKKAMGK